MANLAQSVNVLQSLILTTGKQMILTPTYHVFDLYQVHQDATFFPVKLVSPDYHFGGKEIPAVNASASKDSTGAIHISLVNLDPEKSITVHTSFGKQAWSKISGKVLTSSHFNDCNTFDDPNKVTSKPFSDASKKGDELIVNLPPKSVVVLALK